MPDIRRLIRKDLAALEAYQPIRPPSALEAEGIVPSEASGEGGLIKLDGNENPYGCSPRVQRALERFDQYHLYPDPDQWILRHALAGYTGLDASRIICGAGSDELIDLLFRLLLEPGDSVLNSVPTFGMYRFSAQVCGGECVDVPRCEDYAVDTDAVLAKVDDLTKIIVLASPNNPTGNVTPQRDIERLLSTGRLVLVDEAYYEFCGVSVASLAPAHPNLVVLRTFSKWAGLAGLRVGYGLMSPELVSYLMRIKPPYNINAAAQVAALETLKDKERMLGTVRAIVQERERLFQRLRELTCLTPVPSQANFILCQVTKGRAKDIVARLRERRILIRYFDTPLLRDFIRISVGKPEDTDAVIAALKVMG